MARRYVDARAFGAALDVRLRAIANEQIVPIDRLRREVAYERFLARLQAEAPGEWLLKGGVALDLRFPIGAARRTNDVDIETTAHVNVERARALLQRAAGADLGDYFTFHVTNEPARELIQGTFAYRFGMEARLGGHVYHAFKCDVAMGTARDKIERIHGRSLLEFAGIEAPTLDAVSIPTHVAEKLAAYTQLYSDGVPSSRAKDLVDLALLVEHREIGPAGDLRAAIKRTFAERGRSTPAFLPDPPAEWKTAYQRLASGIDVPANVADAYASVRAMVDPILAGEADDQTSWRVGHGWSDRDERSRDTEPQRAAAEERGEDFDLGL